MPNGRGTIENTPCSRGWILWKVPCILGTMSELRSLLAISGSTEALDLDNESGTGSSNTRETGIRRLNPCFDVICPTCRRIVFLFFLSPSSFGFEIVTNSSLSTDLCKRRLDSKTDAFDCISNVVAISCHKQVLELGLEICEYRIFCQAV